MRKLTGTVPVKVVYDAVSNDSQLAGYEILADDGKMVLTGENKLEDKVKTSGTGSKKTVVRVFASPFMPANQELGKAMYKNLGKLIEDGDLVVSGFY